jgi:hypothetical protein
MAEGGRQKAEGGRKVEAEVEIGDSEKRSPGLLLSDASAFCLLISAFDLEGSCRILKIGQYIQWTGSILEL